MTTNTYRMPARSVGMGSMIRRRTPFGATIDHVIDRIEHRAGDEVRIDLVDPATGWGAFLVLDGNVEVDVVDTRSDDDVVEAEVDDDVRQPQLQVCFAKLPRGRRCVRPLDHPGLHHDAGGNGYDDDHVPLEHVDLADPDADPRELCGESTIVGPCARYADHDGAHRARIGD